MASKPKAKVWNEGKGCITESTEDNDNQSGRRGPKGPKRKGNNNPRDGQNEGHNNRGGGRQRGNRNQQNRGNNRGQNQGRQDYTGQNVGQGQMSNQGNQRGYYQGPNQQGGQVTQPLIPNQQMSLLPDPQYPFYNCPPSNMQCPPMMPAVPIYDADTMKPMFTSRNTQNQPPRTPVKPTHPYHEVGMQPPPLMSLDIPRNVRSASVSRCENDDSTPSRRNRHSSAQRNQRGSGKRPDSVDRRMDTPARGRQQFTDQKFADNQRHEFRENSQPFSIWRDKSQPGTNIPSADEVFNFMVRNMDGKGTPVDIMAQSNLFPRGDFDINDWLRKNKSRFALVERDGTISNVLVYDKHVTCCLNYFKKDPCCRGDCRRYHVCKNMLSGKCVLGRKGCKFSHDCLDENNVKISDELGYSNLFTNDEIISILKVSFPHVCTTWALRDSCSESSCFGLHLCLGYVLGKCNNGPNCPHVHDRKSNHNKPILDAFEMSEMPYNIFKWRVFMISKPAWKQNEPRLVDDAASSRQEAKPEPRPVDTVASSKQESKSELRPVDAAVSSHEKTKPTTNIKSVSEVADDAGDTFICNKHLLKKCRSRCCKFIHNSTRLPYIWQVKLFDTWISLKESEEIEKTYAENEKMSGMLHMTFDDIVFVIQLLFEPKIKARVRTDEGLAETEARRLSTKSYKQTDDKKEEDKRADFYTQWRWYFLDDPNHWQLFEPDSFQHTLEAKYLANQRTYTFSRYNFYFNYTISFGLMFQTNDDTGKQRRIRRRPLFVRSEDVKEKSYPQCLSDVHSLPPLPKSWVPWDLAQPYELVDISDISSSELETVTKLFFSTIDRRKEKIDTISRLQNHKLWGLFCNQERTMNANDKRFGSAFATLVNKRYLFHGTDNIDAVRGICMNNFDVRVSGKTGILYGDGSYFARDAKYSHAYTKGPTRYRYMFVASVLVGHYTKGNKSYRRPPQKPGSDHELFDSCVDDIVDPSVFVVFDKNQYYPEFLIKYHDEELEDDTGKMTDSSQFLYTRNVASGTSLQSYGYSTYFHDVSKQQKARDPSSNVDNSQPSRIYSSPSVSRMNDSDVVGSKAAKQDITTSNKDEHNLPHAVIRQVNLERFKRHDPVNYGYSADFHDVSKQQKARDPSSNVDNLQPSRIYSSPSDGFARRMNDSDVVGSKAAKQDIATSNKDGHNLSHAVIGQVNLERLKRHDPWTYYEYLADYVDYKSRLSPNTAQYPPSPPPARYRKDRTTED